MTRTHFVDTDAPRGNRLPDAASAPCPLTTALGVIGGKWNLIILYWLGKGTRRFNELHRLAPAVSHKVLTSSLRQLEADGLVQRTVYPEVPPRVEYALSEHGRTVLPVVEAVRSWGHVHLRAQREMTASRGPGS